MGEESRSFVRRARVPLIHSPGMRGSCACTVIAGTTLTDPVPLFPAHPPRCVAVSNGNASAWLFVFAPGGASRFPSVNVIALFQMLLTVICLYVARMAGLVSFPEYDHTILKQVRWRPLRARASRVVISKPNRSRKCPLASQ